MELSELDKFAIEQFPEAKDVEGRQEIIDFCRKEYEKDLESKKNWHINETIVQNRIAYSPQYRQDYLGDDKEPTDNPFMSWLAARKCNEDSMIMTDQVPIVDIIINDIALNKKLTIGVMPNEEDQILEQKLQAFGGIDGLKEELLHCIHDWWDRNDISNVVADMIKAVDIDSLAIPDVSWDRLRMFGQGDVKLDCEDPLYFVPEAGIKNVEDFQRIFREVKLDKKRAFREYGKIIFESAENGEVFQIADNYVGEQEKRDTQNWLTVIESHWTDLSEEYRMAATGELISEKRGIKLENYAELNGTSLEAMGVVKNKKYPYGRRIAWCNNTLLKDEPSIDPFRTYEILQFESNPYKFWGFSLMQRLIGQDRLKNKLAQMTLDNLERCGNSYSVMPKGFLEDEDEITGLPGTIHHSVTNRNAKDQIYDHQGTVIAQEATIFMDNCDREADKYPGIYPAAVGQQQLSGTSGRQAIAMREASVVFVRFRARRLENMMKKILEKVLYHIHRNYKKGRKYSYNTPDGAKSGVIPLDFSELDLIYDVRIAPESSVPHEAEADMNKALMLNERAPQLFDGNYLAKKFKEEHYLNQSKDFQQRLDGMEMEIAPIVQQALQMGPEGIQQLIQSGQVPVILIQDIVSKLMSQAAQMQTGQGQPGQPGAPPGPTMPSGGPPQNSQPPMPTGPVG